MQILTRGLDLVTSEGVSRLTILTLSKGAEAAMRLSVLDPRLQAGASA